MKRKVYSKFLVFLMLASLVISTTGFTSNATATGGITDNTSFVRSFNSSYDETKDNNIEIKYNTKQDIYYKYGGSVKVPIVPQKEIMMLIDTSGSLSQELPGTIYPFDYCLYSGNDDVKSSLILSGQDSNITGKVHSNSGITLQGNTINFSYAINNKTYNTGYLEYTSTSVFKSAIPYTDAQLNEWKKPVPSAVPLPDQKDKLDAAISQNKLKTYTFDTDYFNDEVKAYKDELRRSGYNADIDMSAPSVSEPFFKIGGPFTVLPNTRLDFQGSVYFNNGVVFKSYGIITAEKDITFGGSGLQTSEFDEAFLYSATGNINAQTNASKVYGTMYAPRGTISTQGQAVTIKGSVLAKNIVMNQAGNSIIYNENSRTNDLFNDAYPKPTYYDQIITGAKNFLDSLKNNIKDKTSIKIGILSYDSTANNSNYTNKYFYDINGNPILYKINKPDGSFDDKVIADLKGYLDSINTQVSKVVSDSKVVILSRTPKQIIDPRLNKSNLGDGLRRAEKFLSVDKAVVSNANVSKSIIVFAGSGPNSWTSEKSSLNYYLGNGDVGDANNSQFVNEANIGVSTNTSGTIALKDSNSYKYASKMINKLVSEGVVPTFINSLPSDNPNYNLCDLAFTSLADEISNIPNKQQNFPDKTQLYFSTQGDPNKVNDSIVNIGNNINDIVQTAIEAPLTISFTIPDDAKYIPDTSGTSLVKPEDPKDPNPHKFIVQLAGKDHMLTYNKDTKAYDLPGISFSIKVKYVLKSKVTGKGAKVNVIYNNDSTTNNAIISITHEVADGVPPQTDLVKATLLNPITIKLLYDVDIT
ncbi:MAG: hypothetical protein Q8942_09155 [Bacillota bacterium]|nr:hypothetical protein [Bacillota bacterium]